MLLVSAPPDPVMRTALMPRLRHFCGENHLHDLTGNTYRKARIFDSDRHKRADHRSTQPDILCASVAFAFFA
jgi:hypothetical protein